MVYARSKDQLKIESPDRERHPLETRWTESEWPDERGNALDLGRIRTGLRLLPDPKSLPQDL